VTLSLECPNVRADIGGHLCVRILRRGRLPENPRRFAPPRTTGRSSNSPGASTGRWLPPTCRGALRPMWQVKRARCRCAQRRGSFVCGGHLQCPHCHHFDRFAEQMGGGSHQAGSSSAAGPDTTTERYYWAQCVKDETMASRLRRRSRSRRGDSASSST
jgi:hypothetical protein